jgi:hypothetical protein
LTVELRSKGEEDIWGWCTIIWEMTYLRLALEGLEPGGQDFVLTLGESSGQNLLGRHDDENGWVDVDDWCTGLPR